MRVDYYDWHGNPLSFEEAMWTGHRRHHVFQRRELPNGYIISTVHLCLNHQHDPDGPPLIFETMVFRRVPRGVQRRYRRTPLAYRLPPWGTVAPKKDAIDYRRLGTGENSTDYNAVDCLRTSTAEQAARVHFATVARYRPYPRARASAGCP